MARKRRSQTNRLAPLTDDQTMHLLIGWCFNSVKYRGLDFPFEDEEHRRQLWEHNRDFLIDKDVGNQWLYTRRPGTRPAGWWDYEAPEPRRDLESEEDYLRRLDLLFPGEDEAIRGSKNPA